MASAAEPRAGRPPRVDDAGVATRERLLAAAVAACAERGFDGATVADIAGRAGVSAPAIYNHFGGRVELLVAAGRAALSELGRRAGGRPSPAAVVETFLAPAFAANRRLLVELHTAAARNSDVAALLAEWQAEQVAVWRPRAGRDRDATVKAFFALLLGLCQMEALAAVPASPASLTRRAVALATALYPEDAP